MLNLLLIFLGSGLGGVLRYLISDGVHLFIHRLFPFGILVVNVTGCFLMGLVVALILHRFRGEATFLSSFFLIGLLGGYTTFSSFSLETMSLIENGALISGLLNILLSVSLCLIGLWLGQMLGKQL